MKLVASLLIGILGLSSGLGAVARGQSPWRSDQPLYGKPVPILSAQRHLDRWTAGDRVKVYAISPDGNHMLASVGHGLRFQLTRDGEPIGELLDDCKLLKLSPDFDRLGYVRFEDMNEVVLVDGSRVESYSMKPGDHWWSREKVALSPDIHHLLVMKTDSTTSMSSCRIAPDGAEFGPFHEVSDDVQFSATGKHFALVADGNMIVDGRAVGGTMREQMNTFALSPDGMHAAWVKGSPSGMVMVLDDMPSGPAVADIEAGPKPSSVIFSPDSKHMAYVLGRSGKQRVVIDGRSQAETFDNIQALRFSDDSAAVAYWAQRNNNIAVVCGGETGPVYPRGMMSEPKELQMAFPDAHHLAYPLGQNAVVVNGRKIPLESQTTENIDSLIFTMDGGHIICTTVNNTFVDGAPVGYVAASPLGMKDDTHFYFIAQVNSSVDKKTRAGYHRVDVLVIDRR